MVRKLVLIILVALALAGCGEPVAPDGGAATPESLQSPLSPPAETSPLATPVAVASAPETVAPGMAAIGGRIDLPPSWRQQEIQIYAAPFVPTENDSTGFFVLEPSIHPHTLVSGDGGFWFVDIEPGRYVLIAGPNPDEGVAIQEDGQPRIVTVAADEILDIGEVALP